MRWLGLVLLAGCGNNLPPPGSCEIATNGVTPDVQLVSLGRGGSYDDMRYSPQLGKVVAVPESTGFIALIDPDSSSVQSLAAPDVESADASATTVYAADRGGNRIVAIDITGGSIVATGDLAGRPDYVRYSPATNEVWASIPETNRLEILDASTLARIGSVTLPAPPEGLTFSGAYAYVNANGYITAVDALHRVVVAEWEDGCGYSHGFPQVDDAYQLAFGGCFANGGVGVVTMQGRASAGYEAGGGEALVAYNPTLHHLYVRGDGKATLDILATCRTGELGLLASVPISTYGHGASADDRGHVWIADATTGGVYRITDPFMGTQ